MAVVRMAMASKKPSTHIGEVGSPVTAGQENVMDRISGQKATTI